MASPNRKSNYKRLRELGFSRVLAGRYKDRSKAFIDALIKEHSIAVDSYVVLKPYGFKARVISVNGSNVTIEFLYDSAKTNHCIVSIGDLEKITLDADVVHEV